ncbi:spermidine/putrescine ABC transporter membrane protein [Mesomycoplasma conjunctivae]|uniref:Spermidine/putrescine transport system permeas n=1 Tax=Mesomycoplasma conjunctivae (strain ATCC 25834 / NCTC 10147 / HRC/581) TaxID=572263 RepID=C5J719_MESCH|nr:ABC transporter permease subunit [Mesomycoplasma conjunctivae]CAT05282.1 Spermidine/putrescine transport system permeas [Mesomycoplasma conjunctivae]VEU66512.1 spermidine/putrescine ABC transporter membrane protein [Mesomycoplasma conjunctivae]
MTKIIDFFHKNEILKKSYIWILLIIFYIPIFTGSIFAFNAPSKKGFVSTSWNKFSLKAFDDLSTESFASGLLNSIIIALITSFVVVSLSLLTVFSLWRQKNKSAKTYVNLTSNIPLINPDVITAVSMAIILSLLFGALSASYEGLFRAIVSHIVMTLPYGILLLYPRSEKFSQTLFEASQDLGYSKLKSWFLVYLKHMSSSVISTFAVVSFLSFDDFIITKITSNAQTVGTLLYQGTFKTWALMLGVFMLAFVVLGNIFWIYLNTKKERKWRKK